MMKSVVSCRFFHTGKNWLKHQVSHRKREVYTKRISTVLDFNTRASYLSATPHEHDASATVSVGRVLGV